MATLKEAYKKAHGAGYIDAIRASEQKYGIPAGLQIGLHAQESMFNPNAVGPKTKWGNAVGIGQFLDGTAKRFGITDRKDPFQSIEGTGKYLKYLHGRFGNWRGAITAYHEGEGNYSKVLKGKKKLGPNSSKYYRLVKGKADALNGGVPIKLTPQTSPAETPVGDFFANNQPIIPSSPAGAFGTESDMPEPQMVDVDQSLLNTQSPTLGNVPLPGYDPVNVKAPYGEVNVLPQTPREQSLVSQLQGGQDALIPHVPELLAITDKNNSKPLIPANTQFDKLLSAALDIV